MFIKTILLLLAVASASNIVMLWQCQTCSNSTLGTNCWRFNGGPFTNFQTSIDANYSSCSATKRTYPRSIGFICNKSASCSQDCNYQQSTSGSFSSYCPVSDSDNAVVFLNQMLFLYNGTSNYNWCENAGCPNVDNGGSTNTGLIIGSTIGGLLLFAIIVGIVYYCKNKKKKGNLLTDYNVFR